MADAILVLNAGSSSLKFSVFLNQERPELLLRGQIEGLVTQPSVAARDPAGNAVGEQSWEPGVTLAHDGAIEFQFAWGRGKLGEHRIVAAGHRAVHGGHKFTQPVLIDPDVLAALEGFVSLAPPHEPPSLAAIRAIIQRFPALSQVACFDTSFHCM
jgi:acetate kinase